MVSRTAGISLGPVVGTSRRLIGRSAGISAGSFFTASPYASGGGVVAGADRKNLRTYLPDRAVPVIGSDGLMTTQWYFFLRYQTDVILGNAENISLLDLKTQSDYAALQAISVKSSLDATDQQARANAAAQAATQEVIKAASLPGAAQIPPVVLYKQPDRESGGGE